MATKETKKIQVVGNFGGGGEGGAANPNAVLYTAQTLTDEQKAQARTNIGALSEDEIKVLINNSIAIIPNAEDMLI